MKIGKPPRRQPPENTIPLINVVFLMLIFFLFAGSVAKDDARRIEPPTNIAEDDTIRSTGALIVTKEGALFQHDKPVDLETYAPTPAADGETVEPVRIAADGSLPAARLKRVMAKLSASGAGRIVLITRKGK